MRPLRILHKDDDAERAGNYQESNLQGLHFVISLHKKDVSEPVPFPARQSLKLSNRVNRSFHASVPHKLSIGPVTIAPATVLAPMAGVTDTVFRRFIRNLGGCGLIMTEFTSSHGVSASLGARKPTKTLRDTWRSSPRSTPSPRNCSAPTRR